MKRKMRVLALGVAQTVAWASSTYLPAVVAVPVAADLGLSPATVFAAYSVALVVMAVLGPAVGRAIDRGRGRGVLCLSNLVLAGGLALLGAADGTGMLFAAWAVIGAGMALGLYDAAFAALVRIHGLDARRPITAITLVAGFASTVGWPLTAWLAAGWSWRAACFFWAATHLLAALPLNRFALPNPSPKEESGTGGSGEGAAEVPAGLGARRAFLCLAVFGAATAFVTSAMAAHLPGFLAAAGVAAGTAVAASALIGPAQVAARLMEFLAAGRLRIHPLATARLATALHPVGALTLLAIGGLPWVAGAFALLHGAGNGLITIAKGTLPLALFGSSGYGARQGALAVVQRTMQAAAPYAFALVLEGWGAGPAAAMTGLVSAVALLALFAIRKA